MIRSMLMIVLVALAAFGLRALLASAKSPSERPAAKRKRGPRIVTHDTVRCSQCGVHLPQGDAVVRNGRYYCSEEHSRSAQRAG